MTRTSSNTVLVQLCREVQHLSSSILCLNLLSCSLYLHEQNVICHLYISREEFKSHQLADIVTIECRDVCKDGFGLQDIADAGQKSHHIYLICPVLFTLSHTHTHTHTHTVFLDVPRPWDAILSAKEAMKVCD